MIYDGILAIKKEWNNATYSNRDGPRDYNTKWCKPDKDKHHMILLIHGIWKIDINESIYKIEIGLQT